MTASASAVAAVLLSAAAGAVAVGRASAGAAVLARLAVRPGPSRRRWVMVLAGLVTLTSTPWLGTAAVLVVLVLLAACTGAWWRIRRRQASRDADRRREVVGELLSALVAELRSGAEPRAALISATNGLSGLEPRPAAGIGSPGLDPGLDPRAAAGLGPSGLDPPAAGGIGPAGLEPVAAVAAAAARPSGDVPAALDALAGQPGGSTAGDLAAAWRVADLTGCGLADPVARVLRGHRAEDRLRREVGAQLAGPKATAALLSGLPLVGLLLGIALGADPVGFLLGPAVGRLVLVVGIALVAVGILWTRSITASALADFVPGPGSSP